jgi:uncharacterized protein HemX
MGPADWYAILALLLAVIGSLAGLWRWVVAQINAVKEMNRLQDASLHRFELHVSENYMNKAEIKELLRDIRIQLDRIERRLEERREELARGGL